MASHFNDAGGRSAETAIVRLGFMRRTGFGIGELDAGAVGEGDVVARVGEGFR